MEKHIFTQTDRISPASLSTEDSAENLADAAYQPKQEFHHADADISDDPTEAAHPQPDEWLNDAFTPPNTTHSKWKTLLKLTALLFAAALTAQAVQWLWDSFQAKQWIQFTLALGSLSIVGLGMAEIGAEWRRLVKLKKRSLLQQQSLEVYAAEKNHNPPPNHSPNAPQSAVENPAVLATEQAEAAIRLCLQAAENLTAQRSDISLWQKQATEGYSAAEITRLFSQTVLAPLDTHARRLIAQNATEAALLVAISPLAAVDIFFVAWRNIRLINRLARLYGIELGYFTRLRLLRMVLLNMAFAGATEFIQDLGMDWLSQDLTGKLSARAAQGLGVGLLTARLGIKAMEFCRPLAFDAQEKPKLSHIRTELLGVLKGYIFKSVVKERATLGNEKN